MARIAKSQQLRQATHETRSTNLRTELAYTSDIIQEQKGVDQNLLDNIPLHRIKSMCWRTFCDDVETADASTVGSTSHSNRKTASRQCSQNRWLARISS